MLSIQSLNSLTRANTVYLSLLSHDEDPQLTAPAKDHLDPLLMQTYGPPESPWQPLMIVPGFCPAQSMFLVIFVPPHLEFCLAHAALVTTGISPSIRIVLLDPGCFFFPQPVMQAWTDTFSNNEAIHQIRGFINSLQSM